MTNNHQFLTAMIVLAYMTESVTYYKRLQVMEKVKFMELFASMENQVRRTKKKLHLDLIKIETELSDSKKELSNRLEKMDDIPGMEKIGA